ncbi:MAG: sulfite reductase subunit alpha [Planctomycetales bacterium]|nr:sulfite reductase subunit alpha [Planctomycetales bacterium]
MTATLVPESAPFSEEQRAWLSGFLAGFLGVNETASGLPPALLAIGNLSSESTEEDLKNAPWHDAALSLEERMELADGKPLPQRMMAAMAQLDCGSCGYVCETYSAAIAAGTEKNLSLCSPGGNETKRMLKQLSKAVDDFATPQLLATKAVPNSTETEAISRQKPYRAKILESRKLNGDGSAKDTRHVAIDLGSGGLTYQAGDALGVYPTNCPDLVSSILEHTHFRSDAKVMTADGAIKTLAEALAEDCCLKTPTNELLETLANHTHEPKAKGVFSAYLEDGPVAGFDVLDALLLAGDLGDLTETEFVRHLSPLAPRLYSIASSMAKVGNQVHLTVGRVTYEREGRQRKGVASTMFSERCLPGTGVRIYVQPNHGGFTVPKADSTAMIMVGPGTGIAPFMAFLQEREVRQAKGKNWLFFGDQQQTQDFLYQDQLHAWLTSGLLTRLDTAFSRDSTQKVYVQDRLRERAEEIWTWLEEGACFFVCGDASRMAADVDKTLKEIVAQQGRMNYQEAQRYVKELTASQRYVRDVY